MVLYKTILIDPPWEERGAGKIKRGADRHYDLMKTDEIIETILNSGAFTPDDNCHMYLWVTNNFLKAGLAVMDALNFRYITNIVWVKDKIGLGQYFRGQHELCLFGVRGILPSQTKKIPTVLKAKRGKHSRKPMKFYDYIEAVSPPPRLEMFARSAMKGWDVYGDEISDQIAKKSNLDNFLP